MPKPPAVLSFMLGSQLVLVELVSESAAWLISPRCSS